MDLKPYGIVRYASFFLPRYLTLLLVTCVASALAPDKTLPLWLIWAQTETTDLAELALDYGSFDRANLYAQLSEFWWPVEETRGREWMRKAADIVAFIPLQETMGERQLHMRAIRAVLRRIGSRDKKLAQRLTEALTTLAKHR
jgi:hypothetical protein